MGVLLSGVVRMLEEGHLCSRLLLAAPHAPAGLHLDIKIMRRMPRIRYPSSRNELCRQKLRFAVSQHTHSRLATQNEKKSINQ